MLDNDVVALVAACRLIGILPKVDDVLRPAD
jgi:hypothetical protein